METKVYWNVAWSALHPPKGLDLRFKLLANLAHKNMTGIQKVHVINKLSVGIKVSWVEKNQKLISKGDAY